MDKFYSPGYTILEHEADVGIESYGRDLAELFTNTARALFSLITDLVTVGSTETRSVTIDNGDELLVAFLNELLYLWDTERFIPGKYSLMVEEGKLEAEMTGEILDPDKHNIHREVKAATYHKFSIRQKGDKLEATVYLDI
jgi:SHS2 domain-containing protein